jgi:hypothetical protein
MLWDLIMKWMFDTTRVISKERFWLVSLSFFLCVLLARHCVKGYKDRLQIPHKLKRYA